MKTKVKYSNSNIRILFAASVLLIPFANAVTYVAGVQPASNQNFNALPSIALTLLDDYGNSTSYSSRAIYSDGVYIDMEESYISLSHVNDSVLIDLDEGFDIHNQSQFASSSGTLNSAAWSLSQAIDSTQNGNFNQGSTMAVCRLDSNYINTATLDFDIMQLSYGTPAVATPGYMRWFNNSGNLYSQYATVRNVGMEWGGAANTLSLYPSNSSSPSIVLNPSGSGDITTGSLSATSLSASSASIGSVGANSLSGTSVSATNLSTLTASFGFVKVSASGNVPDNVNIVQVTTGSPVTLTLPSATGRAGREIRICRGPSAINTSITVNVSGGGNTIQNVSNGTMGASTTMITGAAPSGRTTFWSDGSVWSVAP